MSSARTGRTSCCRRGSGPRGPVPGARFLRGRRGGGHRPESGGDPHPPAIPGPGRGEVPRAAAPARSPRVGGPPPPGGSGAATPGHGAGSGRGSPISRSRPASPFARLLADPPDIAAQRRPSSRPGFAGDSGSGSPLPPSFPPSSSPKCLQRSAVSSMGAAFSRPAWSQALKEKRRAAIRVGGPGRRALVSVPTLGKEGRAAPVAESLQGNRSRDAHPTRPPRADLPGFARLALEHRGCLYCAGQERRPRPEAQKKLDAVRANPTPRRIVVSSPASTRVHASPCPCP